MNSTSENLSYGNNSRCRKCSMNEDVNCCGIYNSEKLLKVLQLEKNEVLGWWSSPSLHHQWMAPYLETGSLQMNQTYNEVIVTQRGRNPTWLSAWVVMRRKEKDTHSERPYEHGRRGCTNAAASRGEPGMQPNSRSQYQTTDFPLQREHDSPHTSISDFRLLNCKSINFCCWGHPVCGNWLRWP